MVEILRNHFNFVNKNKFRIFLPKFVSSSIRFVVLSITALILASMPEFQVPDTTGGHLGAMYNKKYIYYYYYSLFCRSATTNPTYPKVSGFTISTTTVIKDGEEHKIEMVEHPVFNYVENICGKFNLNKFGFI
jgi:hypothetical protein